MNAAPGPASGLRRGFWEGHGGLRELMRLILAERLDALHVSAPTSEILRDLERCGFPLTSAEVHQCWRPPGLPDCATTEAPQLPWRQLEEDRIIGGNAGDRVLEEGGVSMRWDARTGRIFAEGPDTADAWIASPLAAGHEVWIRCTATVAMETLASLGYTPGPTSWSFLLSPMLTYSLTEPTCIPFAVSPEDVERYGHWSGDLNPLHFDAEFAMSHGFEGRIAHGMLFNGWLTRYLGMEYPGAGTIFRRSSALYLAPVYPGRSYRVRVSTTSHDRDKGSLRIVAQLLDAAGAPCLISYNDVVHRGR